MSTEVTPESVQTPQALRDFLTLLDKQVAEAASTLEGPPNEIVAVTTSVRCRGLHWALTRAADILTAQERRIAALELSTVKATKVEPD